MFLQDHLILESMKSLQDSSEEKQQTSECDTVPAGLSEAEGSIRGEPLARGAGSSQALLSCCSKWLSLSFQVSGVLRFSQETEMAWEC